MTHQDSTDGNITYKRIQDRAISDAQESMPDLPKHNTVEDWEQFLSYVEEVDAFEVAYESQWDWVIYYVRALELCQGVPISVLHEAESQCAELCVSENLEFGLYETAAAIATQIVIQEIVDAVEQVKEDLIDMAQTQIDNLEELV